MNEREEDGLVTQIVIAFTKIFSLSEYTQDARCTVPLTIVSNQIACFMPLFCQFIAKFANFPF